MDDREKADFMLTFLALTDKDQADIAALIMLKRGEAERRRPEQLPADLPLTRRS